MGTSKTQGYQKPATLLKHENETSLEMCGICLSEAPIDEENKTLIKNRGREFYNETEWNDLFLVSSVLSIRSTVPQPILGNGFTIQYNGEIYNDSVSDTSFIKNIIETSSETNHLSIRDDLSVEEAFEMFGRIWSKINQFENETALVILNKDYVMFLKDDIGKRSLGYSTNPFTVSSVRYSIEIDPMKLYLYDLKSKTVHWRFKREEGIVKRYLERIGSIGKFIFSDQYSAEYSFLSGYDLIINSKHNSNSKNNSADFQLIKSVDKSEIVMKLHELMMSSFNLRKFDDKVPISSNCNNNPIIFFSGGIDSLIIAIYAHLVFDLKYKIILINTGIPGSFDRKYGQESFSDLKRMFPDRTFEFIENNITIEEIIENKERIEMVLQPKTTTMSFNIACVMYFSARCAKKYGKIVYLGSGADELFGGYNKYNGKIDTRCHMLFDLFTISTHNICRDDRMIGEWSLEARFPFLDYKIVDFSLDLPTDCLVRDGGYNKAILRDLLNHHGFSRASGVPKKAMQYGTGVSSFESKLKRH